MSRLYLILGILALSLSGFSQNELKQYLKFADENMQKGDYYYALEYYEKAMNIDSATIDIQWRYAEALRAYKNYPKAAFYYHKIYRKEYAKLYPQSVLQLGLMLKQQGKYSEALEIFKEAKKKYAKDRRGYLYRKVKQEMISCLYAKNAIKDTSNLIQEKLPLGINTKNSEFPHRIKDGKIIYSSLRAETDSVSEEVYDKKYRTKLYQGILKEAKSSLIEDLDMDELSSGNGSFNMDSSKYYFSVCREKASLPDRQGFGYQCKIWVAKYNNGKWSDLDSLGDVINEKGANTTMPFYTKLDNQEVLFFASDRDGSIGGMDIWYARVKNGNQFVKIKNAGKRINTMDNELTPYFDIDKNKLFFSSSWHTGFGGYDVFSVDRNGFAFTNVQNLGIPVNSPANDLYFFNHEKKSYLSSNRKGVYYSKNPTCCSDIFAFNEPIIEVKEEDPQENLKQLMKRLPVTLYFHNDVPNPRSLDTFTTLNYMTTYGDYTEMKSKYENEYAKGLRGVKAEEAKEDIGDFFIEFVDQGVKDLELFTKLLVIELEKGRKIKLSVKGFASPLAKTDYNVNLTQRRISSLENYLLEYKSGLIKPYLSNTAPNRGSLIIERIPFGEYTAEKFISDNPNDAKNSIYSRFASRERKIEIQSVSFLSDSIEGQTFVKDPIHDFGAVLETDILKFQFEFENTSNETLEIESITSTCECATGNTDKTTLKPGEKTIIHYTLTPLNYKGKLVKSIFIKTNQFEEPIRLIGTAEIKP